jgi:hypothetical protein
MMSMTSDDRCYYGARGTCAGATSAHSSDGPSDISEPLLLPPTITTDYMTSGDRRYGGACAWLLQAPTAATGRLILAGRCCYHPQ